MLNFAYGTLLSFLMSVPSFLVNFHKSDEAADLKVSRSTLESTMNKIEEYDYVIVGAGSAGSVIANRLSASGQYSVLVLERGSNPSPIQKVPTLMNFIFQDEGSMTSYPTEAQPDLAGQSLALIGARVLGGGSSVNTMIYIRGSPAVYDEWARITLDETWSWRGVLPFFKRSEDYHGTFSNPVDRQYHGVGGLLHVEGTNLIQPSNRIFYDAVRQRNPELRVRDLNANLTEGFQPIDLTIKHGQRWSTWRAFLQPALHRKNLAVYKYSTATKIHMDHAYGSATLRAVGVTYKRHGHTRFVRARKEVIVSAGVYESARLLMLSGIGPRSDLQAAGINTLVDLPVGQHIQDHIGIPLVVFLGSNVTWVPKRDMTTQDEVDYLTTGSGPFHNDFATMGFISSSQNQAAGLGAKWPDIQFIISHQTSPLTFLLDPATPQIAETDMNLALVYLVRPESVGSLRLNESFPTPESPLVFNPRYGSAPSDIPRLAEGIKWLVDLYENSLAYTAIGGARLARDNFPAACTKAGSPVGSLKYWECIARNLPEPGFHVSGSCRMGQKSDPKAVVDWRRGSGAEEWRSFENLFGDKIRRAFVDEGQVSKNQFRRLSFARAGLANYDHLTSFILHHIGVSRRPNREQVWWQSAEYTPFILLHHSLAVKSV